MALPGSWVLASASGTEGLSEAREIVQSDL